jgi:hypothetical protein
MKKVYLIILFFFISLPALLFAQAPVVSSFSPASGPVGTVITVTGKNFNATSANNLVSFGGVSVAASSASGGTTLQVKVPLGASHQPITVLNTANRLMGYAVNAFDVTFIGPHKISPSQLKPGIYLPPGILPAAGDLVDMDRDGKPDVVTASKNDQFISVYRNIIVKGPLTLASFAPKVNVRLDNIYPLAFKVADMDGDGKYDVIVPFTDYTGPGFLILQNTSTPGAISFAEAVKYRTANFPVQLEVADADADGRPDVAYFTSVPGSNPFTQVNTLTIHQNNITKGVLAPGAFDQKTNLPPRATLTAFTFGDMDTDGKPDIMVLDNTATTVSILKNSSAGGAVAFDAGVDFATATGPQAAITGDLDGDGKPDLAIANSDNTVSVYLNTVSGGAINASAFAPKVDFGTGQNPKFVRLADLDGDGKPDILTGNNNATVTILKNNAVKGSITKSSFEEQVSNTLLVAGDMSPVLMAVTIGDIDGDNLPDLAVVNEFTVLVYQNQPSYVPAITSIAPERGPTGGTMTVTGINFNPNPAKNIVFVGDVAAKVSDASETSITLTIPASAGYGPVTVFNTDSRLTSSSPVPFMPTFDGKKIITVADFDPKVVLATGQIGGVAFGDLDGDGKADMVAANFTNGRFYLSIYHNSSVSGAISPASFTNKTDYEGGGEVATIALKDMNGDGKLDVICFANNNYGRYNYLQNKSVAGTISFDQRSNEGGGFGIIGSSAGFADLDLDGKTDVISTNNEFGSYSAYSISHNASQEGVGLFDGTGYIEDRTISSVKLVADINGDNKPEVIFRSSSGAVSVMQNRSTPSNIRLTDKVSFLSAGITAGTIKMADLNNDGKPDMIISDKSTIGIFKNTSTTDTIGKASFATPVYYEIGGDAENVVIADINGDGKPDIVINDLPISVLINSTTSADITFSAKSNLAVESSVPKLLNVLDIDGDGKPDIVYLNSSTGEVTALRNIVKPVDAPLPAPAITAFSPGTGNNGTDVVITGANFSSSPSGNTVYMGATRAKVKSASDTQLTVEVPTGTTYVPLSVINATTHLSGSASAAFVNTFKSSGILDTSSFKPVYPMPIGSNVFPGAITMADIDSDGKPDLIFKENNYSSTSVNFAVAIAHNSTYPGKNIEFIPKIDINGVDGISEVNAADLDGDGKLDIVLTYLGDYPYSISFLRNTSVPGTIFFAPRIDMEYPAATLTLSDINGDGKTDIIAINRYNNALSIFQNTSSVGSVSFAAPIKFSNIDYSTNYAHLAACDIDGDHKPDLIISDGNTTLRIMRNLSADGGFAFEATRTIEVGGSSGILRTGDLNGDGTPEIIFTDAPFGQNIKVLTNTSTPGKINLQGPALYPMDATFSGFAIGDLNGDGKPEIAVARSSANQITVMQNKSSAGKLDFSTKIHYAAGRYPETLAIGDLDADGKADMAFTFNEYSTYVFPFGVHILKNLIPTIPTPVILADGPLSFNQNKQVGLSANPSAGYNYQWAKNGVAIKDATTALLIANQSGSYTVTISDGAESKTSAAVEVNVVFALPANNFKLTITSATCKGSNNGSVNITAVQALNYAATITGNGLNTPYAFTNTLTINSLAAGSYSVCLMVAGQPDYKQCFDVVIKEPKDLSLYSNINTADNTLYLELDGGSQYNIELNGIHYTTANSNITLPLTEGNNTLSVTTNQLCQGIVQKLFTIAGKISPYPVPFQNTLYLNLGNNAAGNVSAKIYNVADGKVVFTKQYGNLAGVLQMDVAELKAGVYTLHLIMNNSEKIFKIVKK